jgi:hypothetical protein
MVVVVAVKIKAVRIRLNQQYIVVINPHIFFVHQLCQFIATLILKQVWKEIIVQEKIEQKRSKCSKRKQFYRFYTRPPYQQNNESYK